VVETLNILTFTYSM